MSNFFNQNELNTVTDIKKETSIDVSNFSRIDPNTRLGDLMGYEKEEIKTQNINFENLKPFNEKEQLNDIHFKKQEDKSKQLLKFRMKLFASVYLIITLILTGFVIYNLVTTLVLTNKQQSNNAKIKEINKLINKLNNEQPATINPNLNFELPKDLNL